MMRLAVLASVLCLIGAPALAQEVERAPTPAWVRAAGAAAEAPPADAAPIRISDLDEQVRIDAEGVHTYTRRQIRIQTAQGLGMASTVTAAWSPPRQRLVVHSVRILRGDQVIDVLAGQEFQTLRREDNLESSMLDGVLTATLQPRDLRVGDILETAFTLHDDGGVLAPHREVLASLSSGTTVDRYRIRASWPADMALRVSGPEGWPAIEPRRQGDQTTFEIERRAILPQRLPGDLPPRYYLNQLIQFTDYADWAAISSVMAPLYARAETLEPDSPLLAEIERIRAAHATDAARAGAALRLVQEQVRYLALTMGEGGYVPATADEVWRSRYGDCKGKTALLLALLHGLGIKAEAVLVSTRLNDGLETRLPLVGWFDHVIVRAEVDGLPYWLDGARVGDHSLEEATPPPYRWQLAVRAEGAGLESIPQPALERPQTEFSVTVDMTEGLDAEAKVLVDVALSGDAGTQFRRQAASIPAEQLQAMLRSAWSSDDDQTLRVESTDTRYDEATNTFHILMTGHSRMAWIANSGGRTLGLSETGLSLPVSAERSRLFEAWKDAPYAVAHPSATRIRSRMILPDGGRGFRVEGEDQVIEGGGYRLERRSSLADGIVDVTVTTTSLTSEVTAEEMKAARDRNKNRPVSAVRLRAPVAYRATQADRARMEAGDSDAEGLIKRAARLSETGDFDGAVALLGAALTQEPENAEALRARGAARQATKDYAGARADYDRAVDLDPIDVEALVGQGSTAELEGRSADAVVSYSVALRLEPDRVEALAGRADAYYQLGRWDRALADYRAFKTAVPDYALGRDGELRALMRLGRRDEALKLIDEALGRNAADQVALAARLRLARMDGRPADALALLDAGVAHSPEASGLLILRGQARALSGQDEAARGDFSAARDLVDMSDPLLRNHFCWSQATVSFDLDEALADCDAAVEHAPEAGLIDSRAMVLLQLGRYAEARAAYDEALKEAPNLSASLYGRGLARLAMGDADGRADIERALVFDIDAVEDFQSLLDRHPDLAALASPNDLRP